MKCLQTGMKREAVQEERSRGKGGGGGGSGDPGVGTNGTKEIRYIQPRTSYRYGLDTPH